MSEGTSSSAPLDETAKPEPISAPKGKGGKKPWLMIVAVIVVILLIGSAAYVLVLAPKKVKLTATVSPDPFVIDAGGRKPVSAWPMDGKENLSSSADVVYRWSVDPASLGSFSLVAKRSVTFIAAPQAGQGTMTCVITYKGHVVNGTAPITVLEPYLDSVVIVPSSKTLGYSQSQVFNATALSSVATNLTGATFTWSVGGLDSGNYTLNATTGSSVLFTAGSREAFNVSLNATAIYHDVSKTGSALINITPTVAVRSVTYRWYDLFNVPFGDANYLRWDVAGDEQPVSTTYPYVYKWYGNSTNIWYYADMRLDVSGKNMSELNMMAHPEFLPLWGTARGGTAVLDWALYYPSNDQINATHKSLYSLNDGWLVEWNGTMTLDKEAAMAVLNVTSSQFDSFGDWWFNNSAATQSKWKTWVQTESGKTRLDIYPAYEFDLDQLAFNLYGSKVADKVVLTVDTVSWGMEILMTRWLREAFMPTEWYFEDFTMHAVIGPEMTDIHINTGVHYATYAYETTYVPDGATHGEPCWVWEALLQDVAPSNPGHSHSDFDPYQNLTYMNNAPGSYYYGMMMPFDYTPGVFNLSENETMSFEWPAGVQRFYVGVTPGNVSETYSEMDVNYSEPMDVDNFGPGRAVTDNANRTLTYYGPIDFWTWSKNQVNDTNLKDEWTRLGILPYGCPYVEIKMKKTEEPYAKTLQVSGIRSPILVGTDATATVTVLDQFGRTYTNYTGTVHFETNRTGEANLPSDYQFTIGDAGVRAFTLSFTGVGNFTVYCNDTKDTNLTGNQSGIFVIPLPEVIDHFVLDEIQDIGAGGYSDVRVTAYEQYGLIFTAYDGTITFSTNASAGTYLLPLDYTFGVSDGGVKRFENGISFFEAGVYTVSVSDKVNPLATGSKDNIVVVSRNPEETFTMYDMFRYPFGDLMAFRYPLYYQDFVLSNTTDHYTWLYDPTQATLQGVIFAPYRWSAVAKNLTSLSVNMPEFMPPPDGYSIPGSAPNVPGAEANVDIYFNYLNWSWWNSYWVPTWSSNWYWGPAYGDLQGTMDAMTTDGYMIGAVYNVTMNRAAAESWLGMPQTADVATWWDANNESYRGNLSAWFDNEGNWRLDIFCGYDFRYVDLGTMVDLKVLPDGRISLSIGHFSWGYEVLMVRWLTETKVCLHEPYWEDFTLDATYGASFADVSFDGVGMYNLHAVKANESAASDVAWVWEPLRIDYIPSVGRHVSQFDPWASLQYTSWNAGDPLFGTPVNYDATPGWFNLTSYQKLIIKLPTGDNVPGYKGEQAPSDAIYNMAYYNDYTYYNNSIFYGSMDLGYWVTNPFGGGADLDTMYDAVNKVLTIEGPQVFDQVRWGPGGPIYHGAPWIEFNLTPAAPLAAAASISDVAHAEAPSLGSGQSAASELVSLAVVVAGALAMISLLAVPVRHREHC